MTASKSVRTDGRAWATVLSSSRWTIRMNYDDCGSAEKESRMISLRRGGSILLGLRGSYTGLEESDHVVCPGSRREPWDLSALR